MNEMLRKRMSATQQATQQASEQQTGDGQNTAAAFAEGAQDVGVVDKVKIAAVETAADVVGLHGQQLFCLGGVAAGG